MRRNIYFTLLMVSVFMLTSCSEAPAPKRVEDRAKQEKTPAPEPQAEVEVTPVEGASPVEPQFEVEIRVVKRPLPLEPKSEVELPPMEDPSPSEPADLELPPLPDDPKEAARELLRRVDMCTKDRTYPIPPMACGEGVATQGLLEQAIELDPTLAEAYGHLARSYALFSYPETSRRRKANELCQRMVEVLPEDPRSYICMARHVEFKNNLERYKQIDKIEESERWARKAVEVGPDNAEARFQLAGVLYRAKFLRHRPGGTPPRTEQDYRDLDEAIAQFRVGMRLDPHRGRGGKGSGLGNRMIFLSGIVIHGQRIGAAADLLIVLIDEGGGSLRYKGWCGAIRGLMARKPTRRDDSKLYEHPDFQPAVAKFREHCENPNLARAFTLQKEGRASQAIAAWESIVDSKIFAWDVLTNLPRLYSDTGQPDKARKTFVNRFDAMESHEERCESHARLKGGWAQPTRIYPVLVPGLYAELQQECAGLEN